MKKYSTFEELKAAQTEDTSKPTRDLNKEFEEFIELCKKNIVKKPLFHGVKGNTTGSGSVD